MNHRQRSLLSRRLTRRTFTKAAGAAALASTLGPVNFLRAQGAPMKVGVLLPRSGVQGQIGQSCQRGVEVAGPLLRQLGYAGELEFMSADTESNVEVARSRAEKLISDGAKALVGAFDSGQSSAIAQVAEQHGVPYVVNIGAAPQITEQGYKFVFRNFPTAPELITHGLRRFKEVLEVTGVHPKSAVLMHVNDTFGMANKAAIDKIFPTLNTPFKIVEAISYDPATKDLSVEVAKAKATGADLLMVVTRLNDAILMVRELVKQRWEPLGVISPGSPGMYEQQFYSTLGKYSDFLISNVPWINPKSALTPKVIAQFEKTYPGEKYEGHIFNVGFTFEALMILADAYSRAKSQEGQALAAALRTTHLEQRVMIGGTIQFDAKGQNSNQAAACIQNRNLRPVVVLPKDVAEMAPVLPLPGWNDPRRGA